MKALSSIVSGPDSVNFDADAYAMAIGLLKVVICKLFRFCCMSMKKLLGILKPLDQSLQSRETHLGEAMDLVDTTLKLVSATRTDSHFTTICESVKPLLPNPDHQSAVSEAPSATAECESRPKRRRLVNSFLADQVVLGNVQSETNEEQSTALFDDANAKRIYFHAIDSITNELTCRFKHINAWLYNAVYAMCRKSKSFLDRQSLLPLEKLGITVPSEAEFEVCKSYLTDNLPMTDAETRHDCNILLHKLYEQKCAFPDVYKLAAVVATFGYSVAIWKCSFSALSRIDTPRKRSMTHGRQRNLVLLAFEKSRTKKIDLDEFVLRFGRKHARLPLL